MKHDIIASIVPGDKWGDICRHLVLGFQTRNIDSCVKNILISYLINACYYSVYAIKHSTFNSELTYRYIM